jgi:hypothetical protein
VLGIRIRNGMFLSLPDPDPSVKCTDPDLAPDPSLFLTHVLNRAVIMPANNILTQNYSKKLNFLG